MKTINSFELESSTPAIAPKKAVTKKAVTKKAKKSESVEAVKIDPATQKILDRINKENTTIGANLATIYSTVQQWLTDASELKCSQCCEVLVHILNVSNDWHGVNVAKLQGYIRQHLNGGRAAFNKKKLTFQVTLKSGVKPTEFSFTPTGEWQLWTKPETDAEKTMEAFPVVIRRFLDKRQKDGYTMEDFKPFLTQAALDLLAEDMK